MTWLLQKDGGRETVECGDWQPEGLWLWERGQRAWQWGGWLWELRPGCETPRARIRSGLAREGQLMPGSA